ncbi:MAG: hypothetical protein A2Y38_04965 [Spirochaetes bacterium GWB1_59_5]|nr:MAG: hypothetical protein A2Y38_04965 [Spirochaetes bacterium GWB1_59_5]
MKKMWLLSAAPCAFALSLLCRAPVALQAQPVSREDVEIADSLLLAATPIVYGEEAFLARIEARTGGLREPVGLVLSGGSARAFAHIGVLRRLEEAGIVPDFIVANSMGSIIGLLYAAGLSPNQIYDLVSGTELGALFEPTLPMAGGILDPGRFSDLIRLYLGDLRLEDLPIPILVACEDLRTKREIRLAAGDFITVMEAAYALPVFFPPVAYGEHLLIDGGITNLVPLGAAMEYTDRVIASSTFYDAEGLNLRNPLVILNTSIDIGKRRAGVVDILRYPEAIWIRCDVESFSFMSFDRLAELDEQGYRSADAHADSLTALGNGGLYPALAELRTGYDLAIERASGVWAPFERAPAKHAALALTARLRSTAFPGDDYYLRDTVFMGGGLALRWRALDAALDAGADWSAYTDGAWRPAVSLAGTLDLMPGLRIETLLSADFPADYSGGFPLAYQRTAVRAVHAFSGGRMELSSALEQDALWLAGQTQLLSSSLSLALEGDGILTGLSASVGHQLAGDWDEHYAFANAAFGLRPLPVLALRAAGLARAALDEDGKAPLYRSDPLTVAEPSRVDAVGRAVYGASLSAGWEPTRLAISFAELIVMRRISLAMFGDSVWADDEINPASLVVGARLGCDLVLMGLKTARFLVELGRDLDSGAFTARLFLIPALGR